MLHAIRYTHHVSRFIKENDYLHPKQKAKEISDILEKMFGVPERDEVDPLDCLIRTILSQNTNDVNRDKAYDNLRGHFPTWEDVLTADVREIEEEIRVGGLSNQKSKRIKNFLNQLKSKRGTLSLDFINELEISDAVEFLCQHKGIGVKTAYVTLAFAFGRDVFPVDTHILRISKRLGFIPTNCTAEKAHELMAPLVPQGKAFPFHINLITFGRKICHARNPKCNECPIIDYCLYFKQLPK
jgi:endonuclease-3